MKPLKQRKWFRIALGVVYSVVVAFVLLEIFLRMFDPIGIGYYSETRKYFQAMHDNDDFAYIHTAGYDDKLQGVQVTINSEGLRSPEFPTTKPVGEKRLLLIGDSVVFGWGAPQDSIMSAWLQRRLDADAPGWRVIAAGVGSWNTRTEYEFLRTRGAGYAPDAVALLIVANDAEPKDAGRTMVDKKELASVDDAAVLTRAYRRLLRGAARVSYVFATYGFIDRVVRGGRGEAPRLFADDSPAWRDAADALDNIVRLCGERGIELVVFIYGEGSPGYTDAFYYAYSERLDLLGIQHHVITGDMFEPIYRNSIVDSHPNSQGHRLIADGMFDVLREQLDLDRSAGD